MKSSEKLSDKRWHQLWQKLGLPVDDDAFNQLQELYSQPHRYYHTAAHINHCLIQLDSSDLPEANNPLVEYALWLHDAVYDTHSTENERRSADLAAEILNRAGADDQAIEFVDSLIMATCHQEIPSERPHQLLVDIDLSILGSPPDVFAQFEKDIRAEYAWVPMNHYRKKRCEILQSFINRPDIYLTEEFQHRYEQQAKVNIENLLSQLKS